jgi:uncharacterized protein YgbK (DUF1537 family)
MELTGAPFTAFCPAFPAVARTVFQGHLFAFDQLISRSLKRNDPLTPMREPDLVRVLQAQTVRRVGLIRHEDLRAGKAGVEARVRWLKEQGIDYAISDGADDDDLRSLAAVVVDWPLMTGGSTVCEFYAPLWRERGLSRTDAPPASLPKARGHGAVLAGSCADRTFEQLEVFGARHPVHMIDPVSAVGRAEAVAEEALAWASGHIDRAPVAIAVSSRPEQVAALQQKLGRLKAARLAEDIMGRIAKGLQARGVRKFVIAGGETSGAVLEALGVRVLDVGPYEGPGTSRAVTVDADPMSFYLKPGKLGAVDMLERALQNS